MAQKNFRYVFESNAVYLYLFLHTNLLTFDSFPYFNILSHLQSFLGAIIDTLLYQLHDSLARLANVRKLERSREDGKYCRTGNKYNRTYVNYKLKEILCWKCASCSQTEIVVCFRSSMECFVIQGTRSF